MHSSSFRLLLFGRVFELSNQSKGKLVVVGGGSNSNLGSNELTAVTAFLAHHRIFGLAGFVLIFSMFDGIEAFGRQFLSAIFILACTLLGARLAFGWKSELTRHAAIIAVLCLMVGLQYYFLLDVVTYVPSTRFFTYDSSLVRLDCKKSGKGGKRIDGSTKSYDINPCYCQSSVANCVNSASGALIVGDCPIDSNHYCSYFNNGTKIEPYIASDRNCRGGQGTKCTKEEPCYPCEISSVVLFGSDRCRTCSTDFSGNCNFVPDVGPYCYVKPGSKKITPCKTCCTEPSPVIVNGTCY